MGELIFIIIVGIGSGIVSYKYFTSESFALYEKAKEETDLEEMDKHFNSHSLAFVMGGLSLICIIISIIELTK